MTDRIELADGRGVPASAVAALDRIEGRWPGATLQQARPAIAAAVIDAMHPRIETADQLDALPNGSIIRPESGTGWLSGGSWTKYDDEWYSWAMDYGEPSNQVPLPAILLWRSEPDDD